jgi:predicted amidophosphoribosyltransferase
VPEMEQWDPSTNPRQVVVPACCAHCGAATWHHQARDICGQCGSSTQHQAPEIPLRQAERDALRRLTMVRHAGLVTPAEFKARKTKLLA